MGRLGEFAKPPSMNPRKPREECMFQAGAIGLQVRNTSIVEMLHRVSHKTEV